MDCPGLRGHSCDPRTLLSFDGAFTVAASPPRPAGPHLSLGLGEDEDGGQGGGGVF